MGAFTVRRSTVRGADTLRQGATAAVTTVVVTRRVRRGLRPTFWTLDDRAIDLRDYVGTTEFGGDGSARGVLPARQARRAEQGSILRGYADGETLLWAGKVERPTLESVGEVELAAAGFKEDAVRAFGRRLYLSQDNGLWSDANDPPLEAGGTESIQVRSERSHLEMTETSGQEIAQNAEHGLAMWAPGTPGGIQRVAGTWQRGPTTGPTGRRLRVDRYTGPDGARTNEASIDYGAGMGPTPFDEPISVPEDGLVIAHRFVAASGVFGADRITRITHLRVNGIAPGDTFRTDEVVADIGRALGWDVAGVKQSALNAMPFDLTDGNWFEAGLAYMAMLDGWVVDISGPNLAYFPWDTYEWEALQSEGAVCELAPTVLYDGVIVSYEDIGGARRQVVLNPAGDPLPLISNPFHEELTDPQRDSSLADAMAAALLPQATTLQHEGTIRLSAARRTKGGGSSRNPAQIRAGHQLRIPDFQTGEAETVRVVGTEFTEDQVTVKVDAAVSAAKIVARQKLAEEAALV